MKRASNFAVSSIKRRGLRRTVLVVACIGVVPVAVAVYALLCAADILLDAMRQAHQVWRL